MRKSFKLQDLDSANCAAKMENAISKIDGVNKVTISFMTQRMVLDADDARYNDILDEAQRVCKRVEPDRVIVR